MRLSFQAVVPTFHRRRPISQDGKTLRFTQDCPGRRNLQTRNDRIDPSKLLSINGQFNCMHRILGRFELRAGWYHTVLHVTPQRHQQSPRHGHDANAAHAFAAASEALVEP